LHLLEEVAALGPSLHLVARMGAAGAVAGGTERLAHRALEADEEKAGAAHVARDERGLAELAVRGGKERMAGAERAGGALAVDAEAAAAVLLELRDVVADVVDEPRLERLLRDRERAGEDLPGEGGHDLAVDPRVVGRAAHRGEI